MGKRARAALAALTIVSASLWLSAVPAAANADTTLEPATGAVYFPETGFWVDPVFAQYWRDNGGLTTFGYPITRVFYQDGLHRQYFERAVFERHEENDGTPYAVLLLRLGAQNTIERRRTDPRFAPRDSSSVGADELFFPETGQAIAPEFRAYWETRGGLQAFGYPLSAPFREASREDGQPRLVQYFERARFELHPEFAGTDDEVLLGHLGREALAARQVPALAVTPQANTAADRDAPPIGPQPLGQPSALGCGFNYLWWADAAHDAVNQYYLDMAVAAGCEWVRLQFNWSDLEPARGADIEQRFWPYARIVQLARERGLRLLVNVDRPPEWARPSDPTLSADPDAFASFLTRLVTRLAGQVEAWQVWNEPNLDNENNGRIDPAGFFQLLRAAYPAIKGADPRARVLFPGLAPTSIKDDTVAMDDSWYLEAILGINGGEALRYFDVLGVQGYGAGNSPDNYWPSNPADNPGWTQAPEFYFRHVEALRNILVNAGGGDKPVWITEMGWPTGDYAPVFGYGAWVTPRMQADYLTRAFEIVRTEWQWVENAFVWHLNAASYGRDPDNQFAGFSVTDRFRRPRPAYDAVRAMTAAWKAEVEP